MTDMQAVADRGEIEALRGGEVRYPDSSPLAGSAPGPA